MDDCVFCDIVAGRAPASIVWADDAVVAFMDLRQPTRAHVLVVPRMHVETIDALPLDLAGRLMQGVVLTARAIRQTLHPAGLSLSQSNGEAAGQEVPHVHVHLLTRDLGDGLLRVYPGKPTLPDRATLDALAASIAAGVSELGDREDERKR
jgi:histidine triad (HIT) family protein